MTVWTNVQLTEEQTSWLCMRLAPHDLKIAGATGSNLVGGSSDLECQESEIAFGQPAVEDLFASTKHRWTQLTSAGYTRYDREDLRTHLRSTGARITNSSSVYDDPCAQQALAFLLEHNRRLSHSFASQGAKHWAYDELREQQRVLTGQSAVIVGYGAIGRRLVELLGPFRMRLVGIRRTVSGTESIPCFPISSLLEHLGEADHVIDLLPANSSTTGLFDALVFERFKPGASFVNVGRGDTVVQSDLIAALKSGQVGGAYLDVTTPEPLPADDPLWIAPNVVITPHVAGGVQHEIQRLLDHFLKNFERFQKGEPLIDQIH